MRTHAVVEATQVDAASLLRGAGLRVTKPRTAVIVALAATPHASADDVFQAIAIALPGTSRQAVYNVLGDLADNGLAQRIEPAGSPARYELRVGDNHHHIVCTSCGAVADVDCAVGHAPCLTPHHTAGFVIDEAEVTYWGTCADCQQLARVPDSSSHASAIQGETP
ncbi:Fur family transcriptional regulator [Demequina sp.]|uniref:Fur family transcriptional regulator n=1 Tax=Demequina sp. TaxID=2050685 RepID=UPI0025C42C63|nr:Fur family transcriptional regulator [Demequina sp.]